ncbi:enhancer of split m4 family domain-containing protein [Phthorimaea operculella]|nr:enhancer of split m4 family domain-containing protein [Phthorimaea operculella]
MSYYANNEYIIATNNSMNENKYNTEKMKNSGLKALLRPLMKIIKKTTKRVPAKTCDTCSYEEDQNSSNESLERKIYAEMEACQPGAAFLVYNEDSCDLVPVSKEQFYVPVHFARTDAGTFFWTTVPKHEADFAAAHCYTECQTAEQQHPNAFHDRWVQA